MGHAGSSPTRRRSPLPGLPGSGEWHPDRLTAVIAGVLDRVGDQFGRDDFSIVRVLAQPVHAERGPDLRTRYRHWIWLRALSFMTHSPRRDDQGASMPCHWRSTDKRSSVVTLQTLVSRLQTAREGGLACSSARYQDDSCDRSARCGMQSLAMRVLIVFASVAVAAAACTGQAGHAAGSSSPVSSSSESAPAVARDPRTAALLKVAAVFNNEYDNGDIEPVYDRWDARSQAIISRAEYIRRHTECSPASHVTARVESATPGPRGAWLVDYEISGQQLRDYWFYTGGRWVFDLVLSNPDAVRLYKLPSRQYVKAAGCSH